MPIRTFYQGRRVLVTGHTGFQGAWLSTWLLDLGAEVAGISLPAIPGSLYQSIGLSEQVTSHFGDIRDLAFVQNVFRQTRPELVFHLAGQSLVYRSQQEPVETFATNVQGTVHVLEACRQTPGIEAVLCGTSDGCYENRGWDWGYRENDPLGGDDPYSASTAATEHVARSYQRSFFDRDEEPVGLATARAGNLLGGGDVGEDRLLPEALQALANGNPVRLRRASVVRPWQHVLEALAGYLALMPRLVAQPRAYSGPWNLGPLGENVVAVRDLMDLTVGLWGGGQIKTQFAGDTDPLETGYLRLAIDKALARLPWRPLWNLETTLRHTLAWYRASQNGAGRDQLHDLCLQQIAAYEATWGIRPVSDPVILASLPPRRASA